MVVDASGSVVDVPAGTGVSCGALSLAVGTVGLGCVWVASVVGTLVSCRLRRSGVPRPAIEKTPFGWQYAAMLEDDCSELADRSVGKEISLGDALPRGPKGVLVVYSFVA